MHAARAFQKGGGRTSGTEPGLDEELIGHQGDVCDSNGDNCNYNGADTAFMKALIDTGVMAVFSGHDHGVEYVFILSQTYYYGQPG